MINNGADKIKLLLERLEKNMFRYMLHIKFCLLLCGFPVAFLENVLPVESSYKEPFIVYPNGMNSEHNLMYCESNAACSIIHQRFWFSPLVFRLCRCRDGLECPWEWQDVDDRTMYINPRAQLKFCNPVASLPKCKPTSVALISALETTSIDYHIVQPLCYCNNFHYFERVNFETYYRGNTTLVTKQKYQCKPLHKCRTKQFCGHITEKLFETYYVCSCPQHHLCLMENKNYHQVMEVLFAGSAYKGICVPWHQSENDFD